MNAIETMEKIKHTLEKELEQFANKSEISANHLEMVDQITHTLKSIDTILGMRGYTGDYSGVYYNPAYMNNKADGMSHAGRRRDSMGRYTSTGDEFREELENMMNRAPEHMRGQLREMLNNY